MVKKMYNRNDFEDIDSGRDIFSDTKKDISSHSYTDISSSSYKSYDDDDSDFFFTSYQPKRAVETPPSVQPHPIKKPKKKHVLFNNIVLFRLNGSLLLWRWVPVSGYRWSAIGDVLFCLNAISMIFVSLRAIVKSKKLEKTE